MSHVAGKPDSAEPKRGGDPDGQLRIYAMRPSCSANQRSASTVTVSPGFNTRDGVLVQLAGMKTRRATISRKTPSVVIR